MIKAIFLDFDGTLFSHSCNAIPDSTVEAIKKAQANGIKVFLCTGRAPSELLWFDLKGIEFDGGVFTNGQLVADSKGNILIEHLIDGELKDKVVSMFNEKKISSYISTEYGVYLNCVNNACIKCQAAVNSIVPRVSEYKGEKIYMASAFYDDEETYNEIIKLQDIADITQWTQGAVDIVPCGICKSSAIKELIDIYKIDLSQTMAIGDGENDVAMVKECGVGIAMGNSIDELKQCANYVTSHIDDDGIYNAFKHYNLI